MVGPTKDAGCTKGLTRNLVVFNGASAPVVLYSTPSPLQQKALDLLGVSHVAQPETVCPDFSETQLQQG